MTNKSVFNHILKLSEVERKFYKKKKLSDKEIKELDGMKDELDQYWDLLRQRHVLENTGKNPNDAKIRSAKSVENIKQ